jgi:transposase
MSLTGLSHACTVVAPSLVPIKAGDRTKTDRRDAVMLARLHRAGELTEVWVPDAAHEAMRDLVRARGTAMKVLSKARQHLGGFLLRHGKIYSGVRTWTQAYRRWLTTVRFDHPAQQIVLQDYIDAVTDAERRVDRVTRQISEHLSGWSMAPVATAIQAMRGVALVNAVTIVAEVGDFSRFGNPRQLMAYLGLGPSEHSSGGAVRRCGITKPDNLYARRALIEGAWTYRMQALVSRKLYDRLEAVPQNVRDIAWKAQVLACWRPNGHWTEKAPSAGPFFGLRMTVRTLPGWRHPTRSEALRGNHLVTGLSGIGGGQVAPAADLKRFWFTRNRKDLKGEPAI